MRPLVSSRTRLLVIAAAVTTALLFLVLFLFPLRPRPSAAAPPPRMHLGLVLSDYPPGIVNQYDEERNFLRFHRCANEGEAFSGSWLVTHEHFHSHNTSYDLSQANAELASFLVMETRRSKKAWYPIGAIMQTLDVLDFSVIHLSAYERLYRMHEFDVEDEDVISESTRVMQRAARLLKVQATNKGGSRNSHTADTETDTALAMLPWLGSHVGEGHSALTYRLTYLEACFWSVHRHIPHVVIGVMMEEDRRAIAALRLPVLDIVLLDVPETRALPAAIVQYVHLQSRLGKYRYKHYYYSESDQVLVMKQSALPAMFELLRVYPRRVLVPHRLIPYPGPVLNKLNRSSGSSPSSSSASCCLPRQNCAFRNDWVSPRNAALPIVSLFGVPTALGNAHFNAQSFRACVLSANLLPSYGASRERACP